MDPSIYRSKRIKELDVSLQLSDKLQTAISSGKHGKKDLNSTSLSMDIDTILESSSTKISTISIDLNTSENLTLYKWYSTCRLYLKDIATDWRFVNEYLEVTLDTMRMDYYVITSDEIVRNVNSDMCITILRDNNMERLLIQNPDTNIPLIVVRNNPLTYRPENLKIYMVEDTSFTIFKGNVFQEVMKYSDYTLSTEPNITSSIIGKVEALSLYRRYFKGSNILEKLSIIFCKDNKLCSNYNNMFIDDPIKSISVRKQVETIIHHSTNGYNFKIMSKESKLMSGNKIN